MSENWYPRACRSSVNLFGRLIDIERFKKKSEDSVSQEFLDILNFCGLDVEPYESHQKILQNISLEAGRLPEDIGLATIMADVGGVSSNVPRWRSNWI